jgi:signal peptide peptidase SppA
MRIKQALEAVNPASPIACINGEYFARQIEALDFDAMSSAPVEMDDENFGVPFIGESALRFEGDTAIIKVVGLLVPSLGVDAHVFGLTGYDILGQYVQIADANASHIILDIDSGGGFVSGQSDALDAIEVAEATVTAFSSTMAASAAYKIAAASDRIEGSADAAFGSIGTFIDFTDYSEAIKAQGIRPRIFRSDFFKGRFSERHGLTEREEQILQDSVDQSGREFREFVSERRGISVEQVSSLEGDIVEGNRAQELGLIDAITTRMEALMPKSDETVAGGISQEQLAAAIAEAREEAKQEAAQEAAEKFAELQARNTEIEKLDAPVGVIAMLKTPAFASVEPEALASLVAELPKSFSDQMEAERGGKPLVGADPQEPVKSEKEEKEADRAEQARIAAEVSSKVKVI